ncbi:MAG TPA: 4-(cytidine 5'-diphospho)-2-C-methyl-D-erythritol kinase [Candidatus Kapabacteria bacterium]|nr:4-(cytidine 5'-diphospho)-2-C-methyl-D-erythritol kinase [Candidatus Kapabacteria bacterium]
MNGDVTTYCSFCKINLGLEVLRKREDGYHDINTLFFQLDNPYDVFTVTESDAYELVISGSSIASDSSNLVTKAFQRCSDAAGVPLPNLKIELQKQVPHGAGLGGGSADAAKAIEIFSELVGDLEPIEQMKIASSLGADVPFFLLNHNAAVAFGIGDVLDPVFLDIRYPIVIVKPSNIIIPTSAAYSAIRLEDKAPTDFLAVIDQPLTSWSKTITNDFEAVAFDMHPKLEALKHGLYDSGAGFALMSGSGSAFFGVYENSETAEKAIENFQKDEDLQVFLANDYLRQTEGIS